MNDRSRPPATRSGSASPPSRPGRTPRVLRILRVAGYAFGACSIFWFFFSFIGVGIGAAYFLFMRDSRWRLHGLVLALSAAVSELAAHVGTAVEPLHLAMRTGPVILAAYLLVRLVVGLAARRRRVVEPPTLGGPRRPSAPRLLTTRPGSAGVLLTVMLALVPVGLWALVSIDPGVLFDNAPRMLWVHAPSTVEPGKPFPLSVQAWDAYERLSATYRGTVRFSIQAYDRESGARIPGTTAALPGVYTFSGRRLGSGIAYRLSNGRDNGRHGFEARIDTPGVHYLVVQDSGTGNRYYSNPIEVLNPGEGGGRLYWGDVHSHSALSDGTGSPAHSFFFARYVAGLDFYALTDHGEILMLIPGGFARLEAASNQAYAPHRFVTFQGVEWTQVKTGHHTCIFDGDRLPVEPRLSYLTVPTPAELWSLLDAFTEAHGCRALALPHHTTQNSYLQDWTYVNPKYVKLAEVTSVHGEFLFEQRHPLNYRGAIDPPPEYVPGSSIADALRMGVRVCLYAASDEHDGHPGHSLSHTPASVGHQRPMTKWHPRIGHPYPGGLTAVRASELTREAVFSQLQQGRVYACSDHGRPLLQFTVNGVPVACDARVPAPPAAAGAPAYGAGAASGPSSADRPAVADGPPLPAPRRLSVFVAQDGAPSADRGTPASAAVGLGWRPDWRARVEIIKNGELLASLPVDRPVARIELTDEGPITGAAYGRESCVEKGGRWYINRYSDNPVDPDALNTGGADFYLVRVVGNNGRCAYAGPIWVETAGTGAAAEAGAAAAGAAAAGQ